MEALLIHYSYFILFPLSFFEWQLSTLISWFLIFNGHFNIWITLPIILFADFCSDTMYYWIGRTQVNTSLMKRYIDKTHFLWKHLEIMDNLWKTHPIKTMILWKNAYMISIAIIASAGILQMPYLRFLSYSIPVSFIQYSILLFIGFHLGKSYELASNYLQYPGIIVVLFIIVLLFCYNRTSKSISKRLTQYD